jgi:hypothetical protein
MTAAHAQAAETTTAHAQAAETTAAEHAQAAETMTAAHTQAAAHAQAAETTTAHAQAAETTAAEHAQAAETMTAAHTQAAAHAQAAETTTETTTAVPADRTIAASTVTMAPTNPRRKRWVIERGPELLANGTPVTWYCRIDLPETRTSATQTTITTVAQTRTPWKERY